MVLVKLSGNTLWRHQMESFSALLALCAGNSPVSGEFPAQGPVTRSFDVFFDLHLIKWLSKHSRGWWFETLSHPLWRRRNGPVSAPVLRRWKGPYINSSTGSHPVRRPEYPGQPRYIQWHLLTWGLLYQLNFFNITEWITNYRPLFLFIVITHLCLNF